MVWAISVPGMICRGYDWGKTTVNNLLRRPRIIAIFLFGAVQHNVRQRPSARDTVDIDVSSQYKKRTALPRYSKNGKKKIQEIIVGPWFTACFFTPPSCCLCVFSSLWWFKFQMLPNAHGAYNIGKWCLLHMHVINVYTTINHKSVRFYLHCCSFFLWIASSQSSVLWPVRGIMVRAGQFCLICLRPITFQVERVARQAHHNSRARKGWANNKQ